MYMERTSPRSNRASDTVEEYSVNKIPGKRYGNERHPCKMFFIISTIVSLVLAFIATVAATLVFFVVPRFARASLVYEYDESAPVINEHARGGELVVSYHGDPMADPHIIQLRIENNGKRDIGSGAFDRGKPLMFDFHANIAAILHTTYRPPSMMTPDVVLGQTMLNIGPSLIPGGAVLEYVLLVDGSCRKVDYATPLEGVQVRKRTPTAERRSINPKVTITYLSIAFVIWWMIQEPTDAARLLHNIGDLLTSAAQGVSNFVASI